MMWILAASVWMAFWVAIAYWVLRAMDREVQEFRVLLKVQAEMFRKAGLADFDVNLEIEYYRDKHGVTG
jgi:hypothetical protein